MSILARIWIASLVVELILLIGVSAYNYPLGVPIYTGCLPYEDFMGDHYDCKRFYRCANGFKTSLYCPDGTVYDESIRTCVNSPTGACIKFASSPYGVNYNDFISYNGFTNYNNKPSHNVKSSSSQMDTCPYTLTTLEKLVFCSLTSFRQINAKCC